MQERRKHKRLPVIGDLAEPIELVVLDHSHSRNIPGVLTDLSAGGMDLVLMGTIEGHPRLKLSMHLPGFDRFEIEGKLIWQRQKETTTIIGVQFTEIDQDHSRQITHMAEAYWECEGRIQKKAPPICFHGCSYWDLCEKPAKLKHAPKTAGAK